jgi:hypothetical protein
MKREDQLAPPSRLVLRAVLPACRRGRKQRLGRDFAQDELVVAEECRGDRRDHPRSVKRRQLLLLDRATNLLNQALAELPLRLDAGPNSVGFIEANCWTREPLTVPAIEQPPFGLERVHPDPANRTQRCQTKLPALSALFGYPA